MTNSQLQNELTNAYRQYYVDVKKNVPKDMLATNRLLAHAFTHVLSIRSNIHALKYGSLLKINHKAMHYFKLSLTQTMFMPSDKENDIHQEINHSNEYQTLQIIQDLKQSLNYSENTIK